MWLLLRNSSVYKFPLQVRCFRLAPLFNGNEDFHFVYSTYSAIETHKQLTTHTNTTNSLYDCRWWSMSDSIQSFSIVRQMILITTYINTQYDLWTVKCIICWLKWGGGGTLCVHIVRSRAYRFLRFGNSSIMRRTLQGGAVEESICFEMK